MKVIQLRTPGAPDVLELVDRPMPEADIFGERLANCLARGAKSSCL